MQEANVARNAALIGIAGLCLALNIGLGVLVNAIKLPVYLDAIGTIAIALLARGLGHRGFLLAALVGAGSNALTAVLFNPVQFWFMGTQVVIAAFAFYCVGPALERTAGAPSRQRAALIAALGVGLGVSAGIVSAPVVAYVFGGITGSGASLIVALMLKAGQGLVRSVLASGLASEPIDKSVQLLAALALVRATPAHVRAMLA